MLQQRLIVHYIIAPKFKKHPEMCFSILGISKSSQVKTDCHNDMVIKSCLLNMSYIYSWELYSVLLFLVCVCSFLRKKALSVSLDLVDKFQDCSRY